MDTNTQTPIISGKGPSLKDLQDSLTRKPLHTMEHTAHLVQCVTFRIGFCCDAYVLIEELKRPGSEDEPWKFKGRILQVGQVRLEYWEPCHGEWNVVQREGWIVREGKQAG